MASFQRRVPPPRQQLLAHEHRMRVALVPDAHPQIASIIRTRLRSNGVGYLALFVAVSGTTAGRQTRRRRRDRGHR